MRLNYFCLVVVVTIFRYALENDLNHLVNNTASHLQQQQTWRKKIIILVYREQFYNLFSTILYYMCVTKQNNYSICNLENEKLLDKSNIFGLNGKRWKCVQLTDKWIITPYWNKYAKDCISKTTVNTQYRMDLIFFFVLQENLCAFILNRSLLLIFFYFQH